MTSFQSELFPGSDDRRARNSVLEESLEAGRSHVVAAHPEVLTVDWKEHLAGFDFESARDLTDTIEWVIGSLSTGIVHMTHPGYMGLFNPHPTYPAECADRIAAAFNAQVCVYSHAPAAVEIEQHTIAMICARLGFSTPGGHFTSGGAEANETAVLCALTRACPEYGEKGVPAFSGSPTLYVSRESHLAWLKIAHAVGIGRKAVRLVETDGAGRLDPEALESELARDRDDGCVPVLVAGTAGTTNAGMIDPLLDIHSIARSANIWFHVDAAWAGALIAHPERARVLKGIEEADSVTIDAHKWFATTMGAGVFLTSQPRLLEEVFRVQASYMPESTPGTDLYVSSNLWSRRFVGLRLFLSLATVGWDGYAKMIDHGIALSDQLAEGLEAAGWQKLNASPAAVVCLLPPPGFLPVGKIVERLQENRRFWLSAAAYEGRAVLRACITNGRTNSEDIDELIHLLSSIGNDSG